MCDVIDMPLEKILKIGGGLSIAGIILVKLHDKKLISCVKYRKK